jgi:hypothetical protein
MIPKEELIELKTKLLPAGAEGIIEYLSMHAEQLEFTQISLENVPSLIIGRLGMIARLPVDGKMQKISQPPEILKALQRFFEKPNVLYLFINLPDLPVPAEVVAIIEEIGARAEKRERLRKQIDEALDLRDRLAFERAARELARLGEVQRDGAWRIRTRLER